MLNTLLVLYNPNEDAFYDMNVDLFVALAHAPYLATHFETLDAAQDKMKELQQVLVNVDSTASLSGAIKRMVRKFVTGMEPYYVIGDFSDPRGYRLKPVNQESSNA